jgi:hypothetical protein
VSAFTPGPWNIVRRGREVDVEGIGIAVAAVYPWADGETIDANASLIAAAPELLEALRRTEALATALVKDVEALTDGTDTALGLDRKAGIAKTIAAARAALAKAEGSR